MAETKTEEAKLPAKLAKIATDIETLTVLELSELAKYLEDKFGVSSMPMTAAPQAGAVAGGEAAQTEEKTSFNVVLTDGGAQKLAVIKVVRELTGLPLGEAKAAVDGAPKILKENVPKADAETMKKKLEEAGAKVTIK